MLILPCILKSTVQVYSAMGCMVVHCKMWCRTVQTLNCTVLQPPCLYALLAIAPISLWISVIFLHGFWPYFSQGLQPHSLWFFSNCVPATDLLDSQCLLAWVQTSTHVTWDLKYVGHALWSLTLHVTYFPQEYNFDINVLFFSLPHLAWRAQRGPDGWRSTAWWSA